MTRRCAVTLTGVEAEQVPAVSALLTHLLEDPEVVRLGIATPQSPVLVCRDLEPADAQLIGGHLRARGARVRVDYVWQEGGQWRWEEVPAVVSAQAAPAPPAARSDASGVKPARSSILDKIAMTPQRGASSAPEAPAPAAPPRPAAPPPAGPKAAPRKEAWEPWEEGDEELSALENIPSVRPPGGSAPKPSWEAAMAQGPMGSAPKPAWDGGRARAESSQASGRSRQADPDAELEASLNLLKPIKAPTSPGSQPRRNESAAPPWATQPAPSPSPSAAASDAPRQAAGPARSASPPPWNQQEAPQPRPAPEPVASAFLPSRPRKEPPEPESGGIGGLFKKVLGK